VNHRTTKRLARLGRNALAVLAAMAMLQVSAVRAEAPPSVIRIGVAQAPSGNPPVYTVGSIGLAIHKGSIADEFKAEGTKVEFVHFKGAGPAVNEALTNGQLDFAFQGDLPAVIAKAAGLKTRLVAASTKLQSIYIAVPTDSPVKTIEDLRGKRVAIFKGTNLQLPAYRLLEQHGLAEKDIKAINLDFAAALAALTTGDIDAAIGFLELFKLRDQKKIRVIYSSANDSPIYTRQAHLLVTDAFAQKYPDATRRVVKGLVKAARWGSDEANRAEVYRTWALMGIPEAHWIEEEAGRSLRDRLSPIMDAFFVARYKDVVAQSQRLRLSRGTFDVERWVDRSFLDAALRELKLEGYWRQFDADGKPIASAK
jgi:sulfonate transport system substrate-binding protein